MGKKEKNDIYEKDQANKKHRGKSKKLEKRDKLKKNKKKNKKEKHEKRKLEKYIKKVFVESKKQIDLARLPLDVDEIVKQVRKLVVMNQESIQEVPVLFKIMEEDKKEINLMNMEDKTAQKYILKLMKNLKLNSNPKNPFAFRINTNKVRDPKQKYTTDLDQVVSEYIGSYYYFIKAIFEFENYKINNPEKESEKMEIDNDEEEQEEDDDSEDESEKIKEKKKQLDKEKQEMDYEYEILEDKLGKNSELINKAFNKIMREENLDISNNNLVAAKKIDEEEEELVGPPVPKFLESTLNLINKDLNDKRNPYEEKSKNTLDSLLMNTSTPGVTRRKGIMDKMSSIEPINKESYNRILATERERMKNVQEEIDDYENKYRSTSLLEEHQIKKAQKKHGTIQDFMMRSFNREKDINVGKVDSKKVMNVVREANGLKGRFEAKEKYIGY